MVGWRRHLTGLFTAITIALALAIPATGSTAAGDVREYVVLMHQSVVTSSQLRQLEALGGTIVRTIPQIGVVTVAGDQEFAATAASVDGVRSVSLNRVDRWLPTNQIAVAADFGNPPLSGDDDSLFDLQWGHNAVGAVDAWNEGFRGAGALVAVLDTGFDLDHPDFAGQIVASENFTSQGGDAGYTLPDLFSHGSLVAGIIAAADNGIGVIGVAPAVVGQGCFR